MSETTKFRLSLALCALGVVVGIGMFALADAVFDRVLGVALVISAVSAAVTYLRRS